MVKKYYAVKHGHEPGVYETWNECQKQTKGYSNAVFKSFKTKEEAEAFIEAHEKKEKPENSYKIDDYNLEVKKDLDNKRVVIFTDGSYSGGKNTISGFGCVIITPEKEEYEISNIVYTDKYRTTNNIGPEVLAVLESLKWTLSNEYDSVTIYHDLELIGKWADGTYAAKSPIAKLFLRELNEKYSFALDINFKWVPGHKGVNYNERADQLAKEAIHKKNPISKYGKNSFMGRGVNKKEVDKIVNNFKKVPGMCYQLTENDKDKERHIFQYNKEKLTVSYFKNKGTTLLQGKVEYLFSEFLSEYTLYIENFEMIRAYSDSFKKTIENQEINKKIDSYALPSDYPSDIITLLKQSNIFLNLDRNEYDYSHYAMPSLRALEGHFKYLSSKEGVIIPIGKSIGSYFEYDTKSGFVFKNIGDSKILSNSSVADKLKDIYTFLNNYRNPLFHFGSVDEMGDGDAFLIENIDEAKDIINKAIMFIIR